jgi:RNA polymerase sigma-70 factor (ECF subfamily)
VEDTQIIELYFKRDEAALQETHAKYGVYCFRIAKNILESREDSEECVNDTWVQAWKKIPPTLPESLKAFLGKIVRDISLSKYRANHAKKRFNAMDVMLEELDNCLPSDFDMMEILEKKQLVELINAWLGTISREDRILFIKRYYYGDSIKELSRDYGYHENFLSQRMLKIRRKLRTYLKERGYNK